MARAPLLLPLALSLLHLLPCLRFAASHPHLKSTNVSCEPLLFVFGASMVDTGENAAAMPFRSGAEFPPYGLDYFSEPSGRWSNGRVFTDFLSQGLGYGIIDPFLKSLDADFSHGANFASSGSTAQNTTLTGDGDDSSGLFSLMVQIDQFKVFMSEMSEAESRNQGFSSQQFSEAIYLIETAHNDYISVAFKSADFDPLATLEATISAIELALKELYNLGARNILVMNVTPLGCAPSILANSIYKAEFDEYGCKIDFNDLVEQHNQHLAGLLNNLTTELPTANWILFDAHALFLDGYHNPEKYGIKYPLQACCGAGGEYNFSEGVGCGKRGYVNGTLVEATKCDDPSLHLIWDSIHPVESFARHIAQGVLSGDLLKPTFNITQTCNLASA